MAAFRKLKILRRKTEMKSLMLAVAAMLACAAFAADEGAAQAEGGPRRGRGPLGGPMAGAMMEGALAAGPILQLATDPATAEKIGLSEAQITKIKALSEAQKASRESGKKMREAVQKQTQLMQADKIDESAVMAAIDEVFELRKAMAKEQTKQVIAMKSILTPEQISKAKEEMKARFAKRLNRRGDQAPRKDGKGDKPGKKAEGDKPAPKPAE
jgi:Spy/CpxP family protein refolding chaperone